MKNARRLLLGGLASLLLMVSVPASAASSQPKSTPGISLSPFQQQLSLAPDDPSATFDLQLTNHTASLQELRLSARDFGSLNDTGGVLLEGSNSRYTQKYGLVSWLALGTDTVVLQPGESRSIPITIENRSSLQPGGHYGAVVASVNSLDDQQGNRVVINQQMLSLIFVKKVGGEHYDLKLSRIEHNGNWVKLPDNVKLRFMNPGNVHVVPRGTVSLKSPNGKVLAQGIINSESAYVLPETFRELDVPLTKIASQYPLPGLYSIEVHYRYEGLTRAAKQSQNLQFISLPTYALVALIIGVGLYVFRRYKKSTKLSAKKDK